MKRKRFTEEQIAYARTQETVAKQSPRSVGEPAFPNKLFIAGKGSLDRWVLLK